MGVVKVARYTLGQRLKEKFSFYLFGFACATAKMEAFLASWDV